MAVIITDTRLGAQLLEPASVACSCSDCRCPTSENAGTRAEHAESHRAFAEWLAARDGLAFRKPSFTQMLRWIGQEHS